MPGSMVLTYGPPGIGKTVDAISAFPRAVYVAYPRAVRGAETLWGFSIPAARIRPATSLRAVSKIVEEEAKRGSDVVIDDLSPIVEYTIDAYRNGTDDHKKQTGFEVYTMASGDLLHLRRLVEPVGIHVAVNAHLGQPHTNSLNGRFIRGGPRMPGQMPEVVTTAFDLILQIESDATRPVGWRSSYRCDPAGAEFIYKDRHGVADQLVTMPVNLRELLTTCGYRLLRPPGMEWMDVAVANCAEYLLAQIASGALDLSKLSPAVAGPFSASLRKALEAKYSRDVRHQNWVLHDAWSRTLNTYVLQRRRSGAGSHFGG